MAFLKYCVERSEARRVFNGAGERRASKKIENNVSLVSSGSYIFLVFIKARFASLRFASLRFASLRFASLRFASLAHLLPFLHEVVNFLLRVERVVGVGEVRDSAPSEARRILNEARAKRVVKRVKRIEWNNII